eukprot:7643255-Alexandrium_andersonii.AAC.1
MSDIASGACCPGRRAFRQLRAVSWQLRTVPSSLPRPWAFPGSLEQFRAVSGACKPDLRVGALQAWHFASRAVSVSSCAREPECVGRSASEPPMSRDCRPRQSLASLVSPKARPKSKAKAKAKAEK